LVDARDPALRALSRALRLALCLSTMARALELRSLRGGGLGREEGADHGVAFTTPGLGC